MNSLTDNSMTNSAATAGFAVKFEKLIREFFSVYDGAEVARLVRIDKNHNSPNIRFETCRRNVVKQYDFSASDFIDICFYNGKYEIIEVMNKMDFPLNEKTYNYLKIIKGF